jgi:hypothetical protein
MSKGRELVTHMPDLPASCNILSIPWANAHHGLSSHFELALHNAHRIQQAVDRLSFLGNQLAALDLVPLVRFGFPALISF